MRQVDYLLDGVRILNDVNDKDNDEDSDISDEALDRQFTDIVASAFDHDRPYNMKSVRVRRDPQ